MPSILITGVSTGIGCACANLFAEKGWLVIGSVRTLGHHPKGLDARVSLEPLDLSVPGEAAALADLVLERYGCPDVVLNNAGTALFGAIEDITAEQLERIFRINFFSQLELVRGFIPAMRTRGSGTIANVTSLGGTITFPFFSAYNSTKWALEGVSEGLWHELKPFGIRVLAIEPGFVETAIWSKALPGDAETTGSEPYQPYLAAMRAFEASIGTRTTPEAAAIEIARAIEAGGERLRYPVAAYARSITRARRLLGGQRLMRFFHARWMGPGSG